MYSGGLSPHEAEPAAEVVTTHPLRTYRILTARVNWSIIVRYEVAYLYPGIISNIACFVKMFKTEADRPC